MGNSSQMNATLSLALTKQANLPGQASPALCTSHLQSTSCAAHHAQHQAAHRHISRLARSMCSWCRSCSAVVSAALAAARRSACFALLSFCGVDRAADKQVSHFGQEANLQWLYFCQTAAPHKPPRLAPCPSLASDVRISPPAAAPPPSRAAPAKSSRHAPAITAKREGI